MRAKLRPLEPIRTLHGAGYAFVARDGGAAAADAAPDKDADDARAGPA